MVIDRPSAYNAILERTALNDLKVVTSMPHLSMKFLIEEGVGVEKGDQRMARECYNTSLTKLPKAISSGKRQRRMGSSNHSWGNRLKNWRILSLATQRRKSE
jgi:hypothetical protein